MAVFDISLNIYITNCIKLHNIITTRCRFKNYISEDSVQNISKMNFYQHVDIEYPTIWRLFIAGSSSAGKTFFAGKLLESRQFTFKTVFYYSPDVLSESPVNWNVPVHFRTGCPSEKDILAMPAYSVIVLDDLYDVCSESKTIDFLFRVLSSKKKIHVFVMSQRFFTKGKFCLNIRNCCNFITLMTNCDAKLNERVGNTFNLKHDIAKAFAVQSENLYPYVFLDMTNKARVTGVKIYLDILSNHKVVLVNLMKYYLVPEQDAIQFTKQGKTTEQRIKYSDSSEPKRCRQKISKKDRREYFDRKIKRIIRRYNKKSIFFGQD